MPDQDDSPSLEKLTAKLNEAEKKQQPAPKAPRSMNPTRVSIELVSGVAVGFLFGFWLDRLLGTSPLFLIAFLFLGFAGGFWNILREFKKQPSDQEEEQTNTDGN